MENEREAASLLKSGDTDEEARREAASRMGKASTERKAAAVRENGKLGGKPAGSQDSEETKARKAEAARQVWARRREAKTSQ